MEEQNKLEELADEVSKIIFVFIENLSAECCTLNPDQSTPVSVGCYEKIFRDLVVKINNIRNEDFRIPQP